ncbi:hypothetical protein IWW50_005487, partial [Coemansia erecta]
LNILPQKSWHVYSRANRERVQRDEERAQRGERPEAPIDPERKQRHPHMHPFRAQTPWYAKSADSSAKSVGSASSTRLLDGDPLLAIRAHDERVEKRRRKLDGISEQAAEDGHRSDKKREKRRKRKAKTKKKATASLNAE